ncbi:hypothetical protein FKM82_026715 [Ascaphus truei]
MNWAYFCGRPAHLILNLSRTLWGSSLSMMSGSCTILGAGAGVLLAAGGGRWSGRMLSSCRGLTGVVISSTTRAYMYSADGGGERGGAHGVLGVGTLKFKSRD